MPCLPSTSWPCHPVQLFFRPDQRHQCSEQQVQQMEAWCLVSSRDQWLLWTFPSAREALSLQLQWRPNHKIATINIIIFHASFKLYLSGLVSFKLPDFISLLFHQIIKPHSFVVTRSGFLLFLRRLLGWLASRWLQLLQQSVFSNLQKLRRVILKAETYKRELHQP